MAGIYCVVCEHYQKYTEGGKEEHLCFKDAEEVTDLVTGKKVCLNVHDCYDERTLQYDTRYCSVEGRHFKEKGKVNA